MANTIIAGAQWGDEGKGKIVDLLAKDADIIVRYSGGNNAGHTLEKDGRKCILHLIPSGVLYSDKVLVLGDGMVINIKALLNEINYLVSCGINLNLVISPKAHIVMPYHCLLDELRENSSVSLGTTKKGIGPTYEDKVARRGIRMVDLLDLNSLKDKINNAMIYANNNIKRLGGNVVNIDDIYLETVEASKHIVDYIKDTSLYIYEEITYGKNILFEGAQGVMLDIDHGTYPYVTSSNTLPVGACCALGVPFKKIDNVIGVFKAYTTRVGKGPFPTEIFNDIGDKIRNIGKEYGATTGRPRRCGWLDLPALKYASRISGFSSLVITKLDILSYIDKLFICKEYIIDNYITKEFPLDIDNARPILKEVSGFGGKCLSNVKRYNDLPDSVKRYIDIIEEEIEIPINLVSVGADRDQTIIKP